MRDYKKSYEAIDFTILRLSRNDESLAERIAWRLDTFQRSLERRQ